MNVQVVLVGAPGSGKSTVGQMLAQRLGLRFIDVDAVIEAEAGRPISDIFAVDGEQAFRRIEVETTVRQLEEPGNAGQGSVVSLGGGAVLSDQIRTALSGRRVVWLQVSVPHAVKRVGLNEARPLLLGNVRGRLIQLLNQRAPLYAEVAGLTVNTDGRTPEEIVQAIMAADPHLQTTDQRRSGDE